MIPSVQTKGRCTIQTYKIYLQDYLHCSNIEQPFETRAASKCLVASKFNVPVWNERAKELNARYREAVSHWNIAGRPRSGPLADLKCRARAAFRHEMKFLRENENQLCSQSMLSKVQMGECNDFWKEIKALNPKKETLPLTVGRTSGESNIVNLWKDHFSAIANSVGSTDNRDQVMNALRTVPPIMMLLMYMS